MLFEEDQNDEKELQPHAEILYHAFGSANAANRRATIFRTLAVEADLQATDRPSQPPPNGDQPQKRYCETAVIFLSFQNDLANSTTTLKPHSHRLVLWRSSMSFQA